MKRSMETERHLSNEFVMDHMVVEESRETVWSTQRLAPIPFTTPMQSTPNLVTPPSTQEHPPGHHNHGTVCTNQQQFQHIQNTIVQTDVVVNAITQNSLVLYPIDQTPRNLMPLENMHPRYEEMGSTRMHLQITDEPDDETMARMSMREFNKRLRGLPWEEMVRLRQRRRAAKNRQYAQKFRSKQNAKIKDLELRMNLLHTEVNRLQIELDRTVHERDVYKDCNEVLREQCRRQDNIQ